MSIEHKRIAIAMADISGYTRFVRYHAMAVLHAERIITDLLEAIIGQAAHPLIVSKIEGDAVLFFAESTGNEEQLARDVAAQVAGFFKAFKEKALELISCPVCICEACRNVGNLKLKIVLHIGESSFKSIRGIEELGGEAVELARRLLKNTIRSSEYVIMTEPFYALSGGLAGVQAESRTEPYEDVGHLPIRVFYPVGRDETVIARPVVKLTLLQRILQYWRVNRYGLLRMLGLFKPSGPFRNLPR